MYTSFFGLRELPFTLAPDPRFLFLSASQREVLGNLRVGLATPRGLTLLLGEAGTGKTTLVHAAVCGLETAKVACVLLSNPTLTRAEFYEFLADAFGLSVEARKSKTRFLVELRGELVSRSLAGQLSAVIIDEAQSLPGELLEEVRLLSNIETPTEKLLNVVMAGQPELADRLNQPGLRQLKQRISLRCVLSPLDAEETASYVAGRLRIAGGAPAEIFAADAITTIFEASRGIPRTINVVADNALIGGFAAETRPVSRAIVEAVVRDFDLEVPQAASPRWRSSAAERSEPAVAVVATGHPEPALVDDAHSMFTLFNRRRRFSFF